MPLSFTTVIVNDIRSIMQTLSAATAAVTATNEDQRNYTKSKRKHRKGWKPAEGPKKGKTPKAKELEGPTFVVGQHLLTPSRSFRPRILCVAGVEVKATTRSAVYKQNGETGQTKSFYFSVYLSCNRFRTPG